MREGENREMKIQEHKKKMKEKQKGKTLKMRKRKIEKGEKGREVMGTWGYLYYGCLFVVLTILSCTPLFCSS